MRTWKKLKRWVKYLNNSSVDNIEITRRANFFKIVPKEIISLDLRFSEVK